MRMTSRLMRSKRRRAKNGVRTPRAHSLVGRKDYPASVTNPRALRTPQPRNLQRCKWMSFDGVSDIDGSASENEFDLDDDKSECDFQSRLRKLGFGDENFTPFATPRNKKKRRKKKEPVEVEDGGIISTTKALVTKDRSPSVQAAHIAANPGPDRQKTTIIENYAKSLLSESEDTEFKDSTGMESIYNSSLEPRSSTDPTIDVNRMKESSRSTKTSTLTSSSNSDGTSIPLGEGQDPFEFEPTSPRQYKALFSESRVILNVGGTRFETLEKTIQKSSFLRGLLLFVQAKDKNGKEEEFFIDRDPLLFAPLLHFLRSSSVCIPRGISRMAITEEALYYGIELPRNRAPQYTIIKEYLSKSADPTIAINPSNRRIQRVEVKVNKNRSSKIEIGDSVLYKNIRSFSKGTVAKKRSTPKGEKILIQSSTDSEGRWIDATLVERTPPKAFGLKIGEVIYTSRTSTLHAVLEELASQGFELKTSPVLENNIREYILFRS